MQLGRMTWLIYVALWLSRINSIALKTSNLLPLCSSQSCWNLFLWSQWESSTHENSQARLHCYPETHLILCQAKRMGTECVHGKELATLVSQALLIGFSLRGSSFLSTSCKFSMIVSLWNYLHFLYCFFKWRVGFNSDFSITPFLLWENVQWFQSIMLHTSRYVSMYHWSCFLLHYIILP